MPTKSVPPAPSAVHLNNAALAEPPGAGSVGIPAISGADGKAVQAEQARAQAMAQPCGPAMAQPCGQAMAQPCGQAIVRSFGQVTGQLMPPPAGRTAASASADRKQERH
jgi:hypothetical protein